MSQDELIKELEERYDEKISNANPPGAEYNLNYVTAMFPLSFGDDSVGYEQIRANDLVRIINQHIKFILFTRPGEIISDPSFGIGIEDYLFLTYGERDLSLLRSRVKNQIGKYLGYLTSYDVGLDVRNIDNHKIKIAIKYSIDNLDVDEVLEFLVGG